MISPEGNITDEKILTILNILADINSYHISVICEFCLNNLFKDALHYDNLRDQGLVTDVVDCRQAERILEIVDSDYRPTIIPDGYFQDKVTVIILLGLVKPTIDIRFADFEKVLNNEIKKVYLSIPGNINPEMLEYINRKVENLKQKYLFDDDVFVNIISTVDINVNEENLNRISTLISPNERIFLITDRTLENKIPIIAEKIISVTDRFTILAFDMKQSEKAEFYGYYIKSKCDLKNWVGNILNFQVARVIHSHYISFKTK